MKKAFGMLAILAVLLCFITGCSAADRYNHEQFYGVVRFSEELDRTVVYIPELGEVEIPENDGCCSCFDGHEPNDDYTYQLKSGDLVRINFKYEKSWDDNSVRIMESYPARFDRRATLIETLREKVGFEKIDSGYVLSFAPTDDVVSAEIGDTLYFVYHEGKDGYDSARLYATGKVNSKSDGIITVVLDIREDEASFLERYTAMTAELTWNE